MSLLTTYSKKISTCIKDTYQNIIRSLSFQRHKPFSSDIYCEAHEVFFNFKNRFFSNFKFKEKEKAFTSTLYLNLSKICGKNDNIF